MQFLQNFSDFLNKTENLTVLNLIQSILFIVIYNFFLIFNSLSFWNKNKSSSFLYSIIYEIAQHFPTTRILLRDGSTDTKRTQI